MPQTITIHAKIIHKNIIALLPLVSFTPFHGFCRALPYQSNSINITTVTINRVSPSGFDHVIIFERNARGIVARVPPEILDPSDFGASTKSMGEKVHFYLFLFSVFTPDLL